MDLTGGVGLFLVVTLAVTVGTLGLAILGVILNRIATRQEEGGR